MSAPCSSSSCEFLAEIAAQEATAAAEAAVNSVLRFDRACLQMCALELVKQASGILGIGIIEAWDSLAVLPENTLSLLESPQGWTALTSYIASDLGAPDCGYMPTVH